MLLFERAGIHLQSTACPSANVARCALLEHNRLDVRGPGRYATIGDIIVSAPVASVAAIGGAVIIVVAVQGSPGNTAVGGITGFKAVAFVIVVADQGLTGNTAVGGITGFKAVAFVIVVADQGLTGNTSVSGITGLKAVALVIVVADQGLTGRTLSRTTGFCTIARIAIVAGISIVVGMGASVHGVAGIIGARILVTAEQLQSSKTLPVSTLFETIADVSVITGIGIVVGVQAPVCRVTGIVGAGVEVVAVEGLSIFADCRITVLFSVADISIGAVVVVVWQGSTTVLWVADVVGTG